MILGKEFTKDEFTTIALVIGGVLVVGYFVNKVAAGANAAAEDVGTGVGTGVEILAIFAGAALLL